MQRIVVRMAIVVALVALGWAAGRAQTAQPDFELLVDAPAGETRVECVRGCRLSWVERPVKSPTTPQLYFSYGCSGPPRCSSGRIAGWVAR